METNPKPEKNKSVESGKETGEIKKEEILKNIETALSEVESWRPAGVGKDKKQEWIVASVRKAMDEAKENEDLTYKRKAGENKQREGIPTDDLMEELEKTSSEIKEILELRRKEEIDLKGKFSQIENKTDLTEKDLKTLREKEKNSEEIKNLSEKDERIKKLLAFLEENSRSYFDLHPEMKDGNKQHWRTELEAWFIHQDYRKTGDKDKDYQLAMEVMSKRREIILPENKAETVEEKNESPEQENNDDAEKRKQNIEKLWQDVEKARKEYSEKDYQINKATTRLKNFFGSFLNRDKAGAKFESDKELAEYRAYYDNALLEHKKAVMENVKFGGVSEKELLDIAKIYQVEANINLADVHDEVKIENHEGKLSSFIKEHSKELVERYKKLSLAKKIAIGAAFGLAGIGSIYIGGAAMGIAGSAIAARRAIMGVITGTSTTLGFEAWGKKKTKEKIEKEQKDLERELLGLSEEEKIKRLEDFVNKNIQDEDRKIDKIKNKNLRHLAYGVAAGLGVVLAPKITRLFSETSTPGDSVLEQPGGQNIPVNEPEGPERLGMTDEEISAAESAEPERLGMTDEEIAEKLKAEEVAPETIPGAATEELETPPIESVVVEVQKGDSLWKIISKQLENHDGYAELNEAQKTYVIDALKDKVAVDPEKFGLDNIDKLKIGQKIDLSELFQDKQPENLIAKVQDLSEPQMQNILDNNQKLRDWVNANPGEELSSEKTAEILAGKTDGSERLEMADEEISDASETSNTGETSETAETEGAANTSETPNVEEIPKASEEPIIEDNSGTGQQMEENPESKEPEIQFEKAVKEPELALGEEEARKIIEKSADEFGKDIARVGWVDTTNFPIGQRGVSWNEIKDIKCSDIRLERSSVSPEYIKDRLDKIMFFSEEKFGTEGISKPDETLKSWLIRLTEKHGEDKIRNIFKLVK